MFPGFVGEQSFSEFFREHGVAFVDGVLVAHGRVSVGVACGVHELPDRGAVECHPGESRVP